MAIVYALPVPVRTACVLIVVDDDVVCDSAVVGGDHFGVVVCIVANTVCNEAVDFGVSGTRVAEVF